MSKELKTYRVRLWASLPASAEMTVEAASEEDAIQYAYEHQDEADWDGSDISSPQGPIDSAEVIS